MIKSTKIKKELTGNLLQFIINYISYLDEKDRYLYFLLSQKNLDDLIKQIRLYSLTLNLPDIDTMENTGMLIAYNTIENFWSFTIPALKGFKFGVNNDLENNIEILNYK